MTNEANDWTGHHQETIMVAKRCLMTALTLKNLPEDLLESLRAAAERDRRSLNQEIIHLLEMALTEREPGRPPRAAAVEAQLAAWRKLAGTWESGVELAEETARIVGRRTRGRKVDL
jgi:plasmid stability protein